MMTSSALTPVIGVLYPGELGSALGRVLVRDGFKVVTTLAGRSARTERLCREAALETVATVTELVKRSDIVLSLVTPAAALDVATTYAALASLAPAGAVFVDVNSIGPERARTVDHILAGGGVAFVDAAIHGLAAQLEKRGTLYLSGGRAQEMAGLLGRSLRTRVVGAEPGQASAFKMLLGGMSKGLVSLFLELAQLGGQLGVLDAALDEYRHYYPGIMEAVERLAPTYPQHAARRAEEMAELENTMQHAGMTPHMAAGAQAVIASVGALELARGREGKSWTVKEVVAEILRQQARA